MFPLPTRLHLRDTLIPRGSPRPSIAHCLGLSGLPLRFESFFFYPGGCPFSVPGLHAGGLRGAFTPSPSPSPRPELSGLTLSDDFVSPPFLDVSVWKLGLSSLWLWHTCVPLHTHTHLCRIRASPPLAPARPAVLGWSCGSPNNRPIPCCCSPDSMDAGHGY